MKLPNPKYTVSDVNHKYSILLPSGETIGPLKSVTSILGIIAKPALIAWSAREAANYFKTELLRLGRTALDPAMLDQIAKDAAGAHRRKANDAADLGSKCHEIFQAIIQGKEPEMIPNELVEPTLDFKRWRMQSDIEIVALELPVASLDYRFGGRLDAVGHSKTRGGFGIVDYKTSKSLEYGNEYSYQVGGYAAALREQYGIDVVWGEIVRFGKTAPFTSESRAVTDLPAATAGFLSAVALTKSGDVQLIGEQSFCTKSVRAVESPVSVKKKSTPSALGF
ncbi:MAG: PD-(D/E)XK nuclease family protein [Elusimicrobia bacterium]|nr:PD-(D/E)XK nuclease family protein [Elusimicrobiota bacterium]